MPASSSDPRQIIAMGGGGFMMEPDNLLLDRYILRNAPRRDPRVVFLATASGDDPELIERFHAAFSELPCQPSHLALTQDAPDRDALEARLVEEADVIYVGGGDTLAMLNRWRELELDAILARAWFQGVLLAGLSAGSLCWFEQGTTDSAVPGEITGFLDGLGLLAGSHCPHYDGEPERRPAYHRLIQEGAIAPGLAADDGVALHFRGGSLHRIVSSRPDARAYRVQTDASGEVVETTFLPEYLDAPAKNRLRVRPPRRVRRAPPEEAS